MLVDEATQKEIEQELAKEEEFQQNRTPVKRRRKQERQFVVLVTSRVTLIPLNLSDCWLHGDMQQFWAGGDDRCLNWHTFSTHLIPFCLPFSIDHFLFYTFLIQFFLTYH
jgi:hypothetical protein